MIHVVYFICKEHLKHSYEWVQMEATIDIISGLFHLPRLNKSGNDKLFSMNNRERHYERGGNDKVFFFF